MQILVPGAGTATPDAPTAAGAAADPYDFYRLPDPHRPWLRVNMITSVDGGVTDAEGLSGGLGGPGDRAAFRALRALADAVLVGAGTVRAEGYGPHRIDASVAGRRRADGRAAPAAIAVVSESLQLDTAAPLFTKAVTPTIVVTCAASRADRRRRLQEVGDVIVAGDAHVDLAAAVDELRRRRMNSIVCEGGPTLNARLLGAGLLDELCVTLAPQLLGREAARMISGASGAAAAGLSLGGVARADDELFLRYLVTRGNTGGRPQASEQAQLA